MRRLEGDALADMACVNPDCQEYCGAASVDYFKRAQGYADTAASLESMGCHNSAKRAREKAQYWEKRGTRRMHTLAVAFEIQRRHDEFLHRATRRHRIRTWPRWRAMTEDDRAFWLEMKRRERELAEMRTEFKAAVAHARELLGGSEPGGSDVDR